MTRQPIWELRRTPPGVGSPGSALNDVAVLAVGPAGTVAAMLRDHRIDDGAKPALSESDSAALDDHDWWLSTTIEAATTDTTAMEATTTSIVTFDGLTSPATVFVDGEPTADILSTFLPAEVIVEAGEHRIDIRFGSVTAWLKGRRKRGRWRSTLVSEQKLRWLRTTLLGRAPTYGGAPPVIGAWRPITVSSNAFRDVTVTTNAATGSIVIQGSVLGAVDDDRPVTLRLTKPGGHVIDADATINSDGSFSATLTVGSVQLWWPRGYGAQAVYELEFAYADARLRRVCGFRDITVDTINGAFTLSVNGIRVFCRGATWVPPDPVAVTEGGTATTDTLTALADAGATTVRIVGGLVYETPEFFDSCAQLGLLVWQDAMLASFDPPEDLTGIIDAELAAALRAVSGSPALAVVSGGSETIQQPEMMGVAEADRRIEVIESVLAETVSSIVGVPYVASSPSRGDSDLAIRPNSGVAHWFGVGGYLRPLDDVATAGVRFAAESLAFAIPPAPEAVERHFGTSAVAGHHPSWKAGVPRDRTASWDFEDVRDFYVREIFDVDPLAVRRVDPDHYLHLGRLAVAEAMAHCYRFWRSPTSRCDGALILAARDLRPGAGWGLIDVDGTAKLPLAMLARLWAPRTVIAHDAGLAGIAIDVHNDAAEPISGTLTLTAVDAVGHAVISGSTEVKVDAHSSLRAHDTQLTGQFIDLSHAFRFGPASADAVVATFDADDGRSYSDIVVITPRPGQVHSGLRARRGLDAGQWSITVTADTTVRYVCLDTPGWTLSDNCFHLAAGRSHTVTAVPADPAAADPAAATQGPRGRVSSIDALTAATIVDDETTQDPT